MDAAAGIGAGVAPANEDMNVSLGSEEAVRASTGSDVDMSAEPIHGETASVHCSAATAGERSTVVDPIPLLPAVEQKASASGPVVESNAQLPAGSALHDPTEKATTAFVLDYLRQYGHATALESVGKVLLRQQAVPAWPPPRPSSDDYLPIVNKLNKDVLRLDEPVPLHIIGMLVSKSTSFDHLFQIHELVRRNQLARDTGSLTESESAMEYANRLKQRAKDEKWNKHDTKLLRESCMTIPGDLYGDHDFLRWQSDRKRDAMALDEYLRGESGCGLFLTNRG